MATCEEIDAVHFTSVFAESEPNCDKDKAVGEVIDKLLTYCEQHRRVQCSSATCTGGKHCIDYLTDDIIKMIQVTASRDLNCPPHHIHYVASFSGNLLCSCHCEKFVGD
jgi:hypothetical protein